MLHVLTPSFPPRRASELTHYQAPSHRLLTGGQAPVVARDGVRELGREAPHLEEARRDLGMGQAVDLALGLGVLAVGGDDLPLLRVGPAEQGGSEVVEQA